MSKRTTRGSIHSLRSLSIRAWEQSQSQRLDEKMLFCEADGMPSLALRRMRAKPNYVELRPPVTVCGDLHDHL